MEFHFVPSLLHISSVKIASRVLQDSDIGKMLDKDVLIPYQFSFFDRARHDLWKLIEKKAMEKLVFLPLSLSTEVVKIIQPMHFQIMMWLMDHDLMPRRKGFCVNYRSLLCWKSDGTIDRTATAKKYVQNGSIDSRDRFIMACNYFFVDEISSLWEIIKIVGVKSTSRRGINLAVRLWMNLLKKGITNPTNEIIEEYFCVERLRSTDIPLRLSPYYRYLSPESREDYFEILAFGQLHKDDFRLCLYQMDKKERTELFQTIPAEALTRYLEWPFQFLFMKMAKELSSHLLLEDFVKVLDYITKFLILNGCLYAELFKEFWSIVPDSHKDRIKKEVKKFKAFEVILNYKRNQSRSLEETVAKYYFA